MSRARPILLPDGDQRWFDTSLNGRPVNSDELELLAAAEDVSLDDLLDEELTQGQLVIRLRDALGQNGIPAEIEMRRRAARVQRQQQPACRMCGQEGNSTRHHFVNKWIMKELSNYRSVGARTRCTVPICGTCHVGLHDRNGGTDKSIVPYLEKPEREFARNLIELLRREHPKVFDLLSEGDADNVYEARLIRDWHEGAFDN